MFVETGISMLQHRDAEWYILNRHSDVLTPHVPEHKYVTPGVLLCAGHKFTCNGTGQQPQRAEQNADVVHCALPHHAARTRRAVSAPLLARTFRERADVHELFSCLSFWRTWEKREAIYSQFLRDQFRCSITF